MAARAEIVVAPEGDDRSPGTREAPCATIAEALRRSREHPVPGILLASGVYRIRKSLVLDASHAGIAATPFRIAALPGAEVVLSGACPVPVTALEPVADQRRLKRLIDPTARTALRRIDLRALGVDAGRFERHGYHFPVPPTPIELFADRTRLARARWPRVGTVRMGRLVHDGLRRYPLRRTRPLETFGFDDDRPTRWRSSEIWVDGVFSRPFAWSYNRVHRIGRWRKRVTLGFRERLGLTTTADGFHFDNVFEEIARPGDHVVDIDEQAIYLIPPPTIEGRVPALAVSALTTPMVEIRDAGHVLLEGLILENGRDVAISIDGGVGCRVERCEVRAFGRGGIVANGSRHAIRQCRLQAIGGTGIDLDGGALAKLEAGDNLIEDCEIEDWGYWQKVYAPAVSLRGVGQTLRHCRLQRGPHMAVEIRGNDHLVEGCEIAEVARDFSDMGAIYLNLGFEPLRRGTVIRGNLLRGIGDSRDDVHGVYADNATMELTIRANVFLGFGSAEHRNVAAIKSNGGSEIDVSGNLFVDCACSFELSYFLKDWGQKYLEAYREAWRRELASPNWDRTRYFARYPALRDFPQQDRIHPPGNRFTRNIVWNPSIARAHAGAFMTRYGPETLLTASGNRVVEAPGPGARDLRSIDWGALLNAVPGFAPPLTDVFGPRAATGPQPASQTHHGEARRP